jgi:hypothetical protein
MTRLIGAAFALVVAFVAVDHIGGLFDRGIQAVRQSQAVAALEAGQ